MPTIITPPAGLPKHTSLLRAGRKPGAKNRPSQVIIRKELELVYQLLGGTQSLWQWAQSEQGQREFYPLVLKLLASYELKADSSAPEPIRVVVYGQQQQVSVSGGSPAPGIGEARGGEE